MESRIAGVKLAVSADGRTLYSAGADSRAIVWDLAGDRRLVRPFEAGRPFATDDGDQYPVELALSPDGRTLARTHDDGTVELIDTRTLRRRGRVRALRGFAAAVDFSPDGRLLAVSGEGGQVTLWDARTLRSAGPGLGGLQTTSQALAFSPDGELLAVGELGQPNTEVTAYRGGKVRLWDVRRRAPTGVRFPVASLSVAFSPDGETLAAAGREHPTQIRDARSGELVAKLRTADWGRSVAFSPDGSLVATGDWAGRAQLWSTETWKPVGRPLEGQEARILTLDFSRDGRTLASASEDGTVVLWDVDTRAPVGSPLTVQAEAWVSAAFNPDGSHLFAVSDRGRGVRFDVRLEALEATRLSRRGTRVHRARVGRRTCRPALPRCLPTRIVQVRIKRANCSLTRLGRRALEAGVAGAALLATTSNTSPRASSRSTSTSAAVVRRSFSSDRSGTRSSGGSRSSRTRPNIAAHAYLDIDLERVWEVVTDHLAPLPAAVEKELKGPYT